MAVYTLVFFSTASGPLSHKLSQQRIHCKINFKGKARGATPGRLRRLLEQSVATDDPVLWPDGQEVE